MVRRTELAEARRAVGYTQEGLAEALHIDRSTVIRWEAGDYAPSPYLRPKLGRLLGKSADELAVILAAGLQGGQEWPEMDPVFAWLDDCAGWGPGTAAMKVRASAGRPKRAVGSAFGRSQVAEQLIDYYQTNDVYRVHVDGQEIVTSIVGRPNWFALSEELAAGYEQPRVVGKGSVAEVDTKAAIERLAEAAVGGVRIRNAPIYSLTQVEFGTTMRAAYQVAPFAEYAMTFDLLECEMGRVWDGEKGTRLPLRSMYLPDLDSVFDIQRRLCVGGVPALCAIARESDEEHGPADFLILIQERSAHVLNGVGRLAVIPKGFHAPMSDYRADARIGATLRRELEEELFGREEVDSTLGTPRVAVPMHPSRLSKAMRWLTEDSSRIRLELTGFGLNLMSGNYEFASLALIQDVEFWPRFGGHVEANWETSGLRQYSTLDTLMLSELIADEAWSNEGLFALVQGLRRLREIDPSRVALPSGC